MDKKHQMRVAIVGSGMAGLVTAYLLNRDLQSRYAVTIFEENGTLSLDSASLTVPNHATGLPDRIDLPMRAFAGGYYRNLRAMYDHLGVQYHEQRFLFNFSRISHPNSQSKRNPDAASYFVYSSNNHRIPPPRPKGVALFRWLFEILYLLVCYTWFTTCCLVVRPLQNDQNGFCETLDGYLQRIKLPRHFITYYLLPLMCSVATCSHEAMLEFPASDVVEYKRKTHRQQHFAVANGVQNVQSKLVQGIDVRLSARVMSVDVQLSRLKIRWTQSDDIFGVTGREDWFDKVVLAVSPDVVGRIYRPLEYRMMQIPVITVKSVVHLNSSTTAEPYRDLENRRAIEIHGAAAQTIQLRTLQGSSCLTESIHAQPSGAIVTTCPFSFLEAAHIIKSARFPRILRTSKSRRIINDIFGQVNTSSDLRDEKHLTGWKNGNDGVWLVGGWCWDGMVLLEGCVVSAMRVAEAFDVQIPWRSADAELKIRHPGR